MVGHRRQGHVSVSKTRTRSTVAPCVEAAGPSPVQRPGPQDVSGDFATQTRPSATKLSDRDRQLVLLAALAGSPLAMAAVIARKGVTGATFAPTSATEPATEPTPAVEREAAAEIMQAQLRSLQDKIQGTRTSIARLQEQVAAIRTKIASQRTAVASLGEEKTGLLTEIKRLEDQNYQNQVIMAFSYGAVGVATYELVSTHSSRVSELEKEIQIATQEQNTLTSQADAFDTATAQLQTQLKALTQQETTLSRLVQQHTGNPRIALLQQVVSSDALLQNLQAQRSVLVKLKSQGQSYSRSLTDAIAGLEADIAALKTERTRATSRVFASQIDLFIASGALPASVQVAGMDLSAKRLLINADAELRRGFVDRMEQDLGHIPEALRDGVRSRLTRHLGA